MDDRQSPASARRKLAEGVPAAVAAACSRIASRAPHQCWLALVAMCIALVLGSPARATETGSDELTSGLKLLMVEEAGCGFCVRWMAEVGPGYRASSEGRQAPLVVRDRLDPDVKRYGRIVYTPTFILLRGGIERGRILGYPGPDFFWSMISDMLRRETNEGAVGHPREAADRK